MFIKYTEVKKVGFEIGEKGLIEMKEILGYDESDSVNYTELLEDWIADDGVDSFIEEFRKYITNIETYNNDKLTIREEHE